MMIAPLDRLQYFELVWFINTFHRLKQHRIEKMHKRKSMQTTNASKVWSGFEARDILATLDMFSFNFVLQAVEEYITMKNLNALLIGVQLLAEYMSCLSEMSASKDVRFKEIARSLQQKLFYEREFLGIIYY